MPAVPLREHQHELASLDGVTSVVFGTQDTGYLTTSRPAIASGDQRNNDVERPSEDGIMFGRDYRGAKTLSFEIAVLTDRDNARMRHADPHTTNLDYLNVLEAAWTDEQWRETAQSLAVLRSCEAGRTWRCYGRPRKYDEAAGPYTSQGYTPVVADFLLVDDRWYADVEDAVETGNIPVAEGAIVPPLKAPILTMLYTSTEATATVGGTRSTWPIVEFHGPVTNPKLRIGRNLTVGLAMNIPTGETVTIDTRPWVRSVTRASDGASFAGNLTRDTPILRKCRLSPGAYVLTFEGVDPTGTAWTRLRWRSARTRP